MLLAAAGSAGATISRLCECTGCAVQGQPLGLCAGIAAVSGCYPFRMNLRPAETSDLANIASLMNLAYRGTGPVAGWTSETYIEGDRTSEAALQRQLSASPHGSLLIAKDDAKPAGIRGCVWLEPLAEGTWYLGSLTVDPALQNSGLGRTLLASAEEWAVHRGATRMQMTVINIRDTLIAWYERRGYRLTGETHQCPYGDNKFGKPLRNDLSFVVLEKKL